jgi:two-component system, chemotaxis family, chemotaxis protein CheY
MRILVADDSRVMRQLIVRALRQAGYGYCEVVEAVDGRDALSKVYEVDPDVVLSDWNMPRMTGIDLLSTLRAGGDQRPFGFVTSEASDPMRASAERAGASFLIAKPFTWEAFRDALEPVVGAA